MGWGVGQIKWGATVPPPGDCSWLDQFDSYGSGLIPTTGTYRLGSAPVPPLSSTTWAAYAPDAGGFALPAPSDDGQAHSANGMLSGIARGFPDCDPQEIYILRADMFPTSTSILSIGFAFSGLAPPDYPLLEWRITGSVTTPSPMWQGGPLTAFGGTNAPGTYSIVYNALTGNVQMFNNGVLKYDGVIIESGTTPQTGPPQAAVLTLEGSVAEPGGVSPMGVACESA